MFARADDRDPPLATPVPPDRFRAVNRMDNKNLAAMSAAILANGENKAHVRRSQVAAKKEPKAPPRVMDLHSLAGKIRQAKTVEDVDKALEQALKIGEGASQKTIRRWKRTAEVRKQELARS